MTVHAIFSGTYDRFSKKNQQRKKIKIRALLRKKAQRQKTRYATGGCVKEQYLLHISQRNRGLSRYCCFHAPENACVSVTPPSGRLGGQIFTAQNQYSRIKKTNTNIHSSCSTQNQIHSLFF